MTEKFNLKDYQKIDGHGVIEHRLKEDHLNTDIQDITEEQLSANRVGEADVTIEALLNKCRVDSDFEIIERKLDTKKANFELKFRNPSAYEGDINKLEEKRLLGDPVEDEPYESASETPDKMRWWETDKKKNDLTIV